jgi:hypothetical protein
MSVAIKHPGSTPASTQPLPTTVPDEVAAALSLYRASAKEETATNIADNISRR